VSDQDVGGVLSMESAKDIDMLALEIPSYLCGEHGPVVVPTKQVSPPTTSVLYVKAIL
jgi:hypothetical protein